ncbi:MCE family protein [bacterium]|nr:MCE family protein [bacterium]
MREPSKGFDRELQVGLFVFLSCLIIAAFSFRITDSPIFRKGNDFVVYLSDATGIFKNSKVKMAGIDIGIIKKIELDDGKARITILVDEGNVIPEGSIVVPRPLGILGDKYLEVQLPKAQGEPEASNGKYRSRSLLDWIFPSAVAEEARKNYKSGDVLQSKESAATMDDVLKKVGDASTDLKDISHEVKGFVKDNRKELTEFISSLNRISSKIENTLNDLDSDKISADIKRLSEAAGELGESAKNVRKITEKIDRGEGTIGKLVNDPETVDQLNRTLNTINAVVERARRTRIIVDIYGEQLFDDSVTKTYAGFSIMPREDVGYRAQLVFDPAGTEENTVTEESVNGGATTTTTKRVTTLNELKYSLQFIKKVGPMGIRLGVFESSGGFALDWEAWRKTLWLSVEAFDFGRDANNAHVKAYATVNFLRYFNLSAGVDDAFAKTGASRERSFFAGIGLHFDDEDIKMLFVLPGVP